MLDNRQHRTTIPERRETNYLRPMYDLPKLFVSKYFPHPGQKRGIQAEQIPNQKLKYDFQKAETGVISGAFCIFTKLSCTCIGWDFRRMGKKNNWERSNYLRTININYWHLHRRLVLWTTWVERPYKTLRAFSWHLIAEQN